MKNLLPIFCLLLVLAFAKGQNLVNNPSFEDTLGCPVGYPDLDTKCMYWKSFRGSPDYMNDCSSICGYYNGYGYQQPHSGKAYAGILTYRVTISDAREHIGVQLTSPLIIGTKYFISFFVCSAYNYTGMNIASNKIGALVTTYQYSDPAFTMTLPNSSTLFNDTILEDTINWHQISGSFIADSAYQYLVIGNWFDDNNIDTIHFPYQIVPQGAYYYLDDICLSTDSTYANSWTGISENKTNNTISVYPNPASDELTIQSDVPIEKAELINSIGHTVFITSLQNEKRLKLSSINLNNGIYLIKINTKSSIYNSKIIINN